MRIVIADTGSINYPVLIGPIEQCARLQVTMGPPDESVRNTPQESVLATVCRRSLDVRDKRSVGAEIRHPAGRASRDIWLLLCSAYRQSAQESRLQLADHGKAPVLHEAGNRQRIQLRHFLLSDRKYLHHLSSETMDILGSWEFTCS